MNLRHGSLFSQLLGIVNRGLFERMVRETGAEKGAKGFGCWDQLVAMLFCQLAQARSLREITGGLQCCEGKLRHLKKRKGSVPSIDNSGVGEVKRGYGKAVEDRI